MQCIVVACPCWNFSIPSDYFPKTEVVFYDFFHETFIQQSCGLNVSLQM